MDQGTGGAAEEQDLRTGGGQAGLDTEAKQQQIASTRGAHDHRKGGPDGGASGAGADLRIGSGAGAVRLPTRSGGARRNSGGPQLVEYRPHAGDRRGFERLL